MFTPPGSHYAPRAGTGDAMITKLTRLALAALATAPLAGCGYFKTARPQPLTPDAFTAPRAATVQGNGVATDSGGPVGAGERARPAIAIPLDKPANPTPKL